MTFYQHTLTRIHIHALTVVDINDLKRAQSLDLDQFILLQRLLDDIEHLSDETRCVFLVHAITFREHSGQLYQ